MSAFASLLAAGVLAFVVRSSLVHALHGRQLPVWLDRGFAAAIPAGLAATVVVAVAANGDWRPARAGALALAGLVASRTHSMLTVVGAGLAALWAFQAVGTG
jgi:branched-subunit amino acid transport protein